MWISVFLIESGLRPKIEFEPAIPFIDIVVGTEMGKSRDRGAKVLSLDPRLNALEILVDELIKDVPSEEKVRIGMENVGLPYTADPIARMTSVLTALDDIRAQQRVAEKEI